MTFGFKNLRKSAAVKDKTQLFMYA